MVRPWNEWLIVWGYDINEPAARGRREGRGPDRTESARSSGHRRGDHRYVVVGQQRDVRDPSAEAAGVLRRRRRAPAPAVERARLEHLDPGLVQPGLEAGRGAARAGRRRRCSKPIRPSGRRSPGRSSSGPTSRAASSCSSSRCWACSTPRTRPRWRPGSRSGRRTPRPGRPSGRRWCRRWSSSTTSSTRTASRWASSTPRTRSCRTAAPGRRRPATPSCTSSRARCRGPVAARLGGRRPRQGVDPRPLPDGPVHAAHRHFRGGLGEAADEGGGGLGVPLEAVVIGPGRAVTDLYYDWARLREVEEDGVLLVRPDKHIGWRSPRLPADPAAALRTALTESAGPMSEQEQREADLTARVVASFDGTRRPAAKAADAGAGPAPARVRPRGPADRARVAAGDRLPHRHRPHHRRAAAGVHPALGRARRVDADHHDQQRGVRERHRGDGRRPVLHRGLARDRAGRRHRGRGARASRAGSRARSPTPTASRCRTR